MAIEIDWDNAGEAAKTLDAMYPTSKEYTTFTIVGMKWVVRHEITEDILNVSQIIYTTLSGEPATRPMVETITMETLVGTLLENTSTNKLVLGSSVKRFLLKQGYSEEEMCEDKLSKNK